MTKLLKRSWGLILIGTGFLILTILSCWSANNLARFQVWQVAAVATTNQMKITFSGYSENRETLTNFPALVTLGTNLTGFAYSQFRTLGGYDLRFTNAGGTELNYEIESWGSTGNSNSYVWVQVPLLTNGTVITATWGDATKTQQAYTTNGATWDSYVIVCHLANTNGVISLRDSSPGNYAVSDFGVGNVTTTNGMLDGGGYFNGSGLKTASVTLSNLVAFSAWVASKSKGINAGLDRIIESTFLTSYNLSGNINDTKYLWSVDYLDTPVIGGTWTTDSSWHHVVGTFDGVTGRLFYDGALVGSPSTPTAPGVVASPIYLSIKESLGLYYGMIGNGDEFRVRGVSSSTNWVWAEYMNMASNSVFGSYGEIVVQ